MSDILEELRGWRDERGYPTPGEMLDKATAEITRLRAEVERLRMTDAEPVAWAVTIGPPHDLSVYEAFAEHQKDEAVSLARECLFGQTDRPLPLAPLYFAPTPKGA